MCMWRDRQVRIATRIRFSREWMVKTAQKSLSAPIVINLPMFDDI